MTRMKDDEANLYEVMQRFPDGNLIELALDLEICKRQRAEYLVRKLARTHKHLDAQFMIEEMREKELKVKQDAMRDITEDDIDTELFEEEEDIGDIQRQSR